jgi:uncharacterized membrane protein YvbJ
LSKIYCPSCGRENDEGAAFCVSCGAALARPVAGAQYAGPRARRSDDCFGQREGDECFGLPWGGLIAALIFGGLLILFGVATYAKWDLGNFVGPLVLVLLGVLLIAGALYRRGKQPK